MTIGSRVSAAVRSLAIAVPLVLASVGSAAAGIGIFGEYGRSIAASGGDIPPTLSLTPGYSPALDRNEFSIGLATDTNLARDQLINFRFDFGFHTSMFADTTLDTVSGNGYGGVLDFALGFGILRSESMRLWIAPDARVNVDYSGSHFLSAFTGDALDVQLGVGPKVGLNLHAGDHATVTLSAAYNYKWGWLVFPDSSGAGSLTHRDHYVGVNLAFFWRGGDDRYDRLGLDQYGE